MTKEEQEELLLRIKVNVDRLTTDEDNEEIMKEIVCGFYKKGRCPDCKGCSQPLDQIIECKEAYLDKIETKPMEVWEKSFDKLIMRDKKPLEEILELGLQCSKCYLSDTCPEYIPNHSCSIDWGEEVKEPKEMLDNLIRMQHVRINRAGKIEVMDGGIPDQTLSQEMDRLQSMIETRNSFNIDKFSLHIQGSQQSGGGQSEGILSKLFGPKKDAELPPAEAPKMIDIPHTEETPIPIPVNEPIKLPKRKK